MRERSSWLPSANILKYYFNWYCWVNSLSFKMLVHPKVALLVLVVEGEFRSCDFNLALFPLHAASLIGSYACVSIGFWLEWGLQQA